jgi:hypothetical protein
MDLLPRRIARSLCAAATLLMTAASARADGPSDQARAEALFAEGRRLLTTSRFAEACPKFAESERLDPAIGTQLNLGDCYEKTGQTASAWAVFRDAAAEAQRTNDARRGSVASERATALALRLVRLTIVVPAASRAPGLQVKRDGVAIDSAAWGEPTPMDPGWHAIEATAPGKRRWTAPVTIDAARALTEITVPPLEDLAAPTSTTDASAAGRSQRIAAVVVAGTGVAALGVGAIFTGLAVARNHDSDAHCRGNLCDALGVEQRAEALGNARASTVSVIAGLAAIGGGAALWFTAPAGPKKPHSTGIQAAPAISSEQIGVTVRGAF